MTKPSEKSPQIEGFLEKNFGRTTAIRGNKCLPPPTGCGKKVNPDQVDPDHQRGEESFRDALSVREYAISGLCQDCQDDVFGQAET